MDARAPEGMITLTRAAEIAGMTRAAMHAWRRRGVIHAIEVAGQWMTTPAEIQRGLETVKPHRPRRGQPTPEAFGLLPLSAIAEKLGKPTHQLETLAERGLMHAQLIGDVYYGTVHEAIRGLEQAAREGAQVPPEDMANDADGHVG